MNRIIKFRAWDKGADYLEDHVPKMIYDIEHVYDSNENCFGSYLNDPQRYEVMQFTGLLDRSGKEIFEGDIIKMHQFLFDGNEYEEETTGVIKWGEYGWLISQIKGKDVSDYMGYSNGEAESYLVGFFGLHGDSFEIIGNVYQNQELIN